MYFVMAVSEKHIYGVIANEIANTAKVFIHFLEKLLECRNKLIEENDAKVWFLIDNASIHKTADVKRYTKQKSISLLTIPSYSPALNGAEIIIHAIKSKVKQRQSQGR